MKSEATVIAVKQTHAVVEAQRLSACEGCHKAENGQECTVCSLMGGQRRFQAKAANPIGAKVGDRVRIESRTDRMLWYAALVFLLPLLVTLLCWGIAAGITQSQTVRAICAAGGFAVSFFGIYLYSKFVQKKRYDVVITEIIHT